MDFRALGREAKKLRPREYAFMSDEDAGQAWMDTHPGKLPDDFVKKLVTPKPETTAIAPLPKRVLSLPRLEFPKDDLIQAMQVDTTANATVEYVNHRINTRDGDKPGLFAFFARKGEEARTKLANAEAAHVLALSNIEAAKQQLQATAFKGATLQKDLIRAKILELANAQIQLATAQQQLEFIGIQTQLAQEAAAAGYTVGVYEQLQTKEHEVNLELRKIEHEIGLQLHKVAQEKEIEFTYQQKTIEAETDAALRLANTDEIIREGKVKAVLAYSKKLQGKLTPFERSIYEREIARLEKELYG